MKHRRSGAVGSRADETTTVLGVALEIKNQRVSEGDTDAYFLSLTHRVSERLQPLDLA